MSDNHPLVSILMSVFDTPAKYLREAIESLIGQSYDHLQILIVNDGSRERETLGVLEEYDRIDDRVSVINNPENIGLTRSLNIGLEKCDGKYIARMDSDDISIGDRIEKQVAYLEQHDDVALAGSNILIFSDDINDSVLSFHNSRYMDDDIYNISMLFEHFGPAHPTFMFRKSFLKEHQIHYREEFRRAQDYAIKADILKAGGVIRTMPEALLYYREHEKQVSYAFHDEQSLCHRKISEEYIQWCFPKLGEENCKVLSTMSSSVYEYDVDQYIHAIKSLIRLNNETGKYDIVLFRDEIKYKWVDKVYRVMKLDGNSRGWRYPYTWTCFPAFFRLKKGKRIS